MPSFTSIFKNDTALVPDEDIGFLGVDTSVDPTLIRTTPALRDVSRQGGTPPGMAAEAYNMRFRDGIATTRRGMVQPVHFDHSFGQIVGAGRFSDADGTEWFLIAEPNRVTAVSDGRNPAEIALPSATTLPTAHFVQGLGQVVLFRGTSATPLVWDGSFASTSAGFEPVATLAASGDYTDPIPAADFGVEMVNRLFVPLGTDQVAVSDILDFQRYDPDLSVFRFNDGESGSIVALAPFRRERLLVLKDRSTYILDNVRGDLSETVAQQLNSEIGCISRRTVAMVGGDIFWLARGGVYRLTEVIEDSMQTQEVPVSLEVEKWVRRINWEYAHKAAALVAGRYYYLAVPLDDSTRNNAMLVYDTVTRTWQGLDVVGDPNAPVVPTPLSTQEAITTEGGIAITTEAGTALVTEGGGTAASSTTTRTTYVWAWDPILGLTGQIGAGVAAAVPPTTFDFMLKGRLWGREVGFAIDGARGRVLALEQETGIDRIAGREVPITSELTTRGYMFGGHGTKHVHRLNVAVATLDATLQVYRSTEGVREEKQVITSLTRSRTTSLLHAVSARDPQNREDDQAEPYWEDYTVTAGDGAVPATSGLVLGLHQSYDIAVPCNARSRSASVRVRSTTGSFRLKSVRLEAEAETSRNRPAH